MLSAWQALHICWMSCSVDRNILRSIETCHHTFTTAPQFEPLANSRLTYYDDWLQPCATVLKSSTRPGCLLAEQLRVVVLFAIHEQYDQRHRAEAELVGHSKRKRKLILFALPSMTGYIPAQCPHLCVSKEYLA